jgi:NitT/TauT family transport system permease protein
MSRAKLLFLQVLVAVVTIGAWHIFATYSIGGVRLLPPFFFSTPYEVAARVIKWFVEGTIW